MQLRRQIKFGSVPCSASVHDGGRSVGFHPCSFKAVIEAEDGKAYCKIHDPKYVAAKDAERQAKWDAEYARKKASWERLHIRNSMYEKMITLLERIRGDLKFDQIHFRGEISRTVNKAKRGLEPNAKKRD